MTDHPDNVARLREIAVSVDRTRNCERWPMTPAETDREWLLAQLTDETAHEAHTMRLLKSAEREIETLKAQLTARETDTTAFTAGWDARQRRATESTVESRESDVRADQREADVARFVGTVARETDGIEGLRTGLMEAVELMRCLLARSDFDRSDAAITRRHLKRWEAALVSRATRGGRTTNRDDVTHSAGPVTAPAHIHAAENQKASDDV